MSNRTTITTPAEREIRIERIFSASREQVWQAMTDPKLVAKWWGRGNRLDVEQLEVKRGGYWRFVEYGPDGVHGFGGRFREVSPPERLVQTFEWDGMPGHVVVETITLEPLDDQRTRVVTVSLFHTVEERDGMLKSGMQEGLNQSYAALDKLLEATPAPSKSSDSPLQAETGHARRQDQKAVVKKVAFTMVPATDVARARAFYEEKLGLLVGMAGGQGGKFWVEYDLPGGGCVALTNTSGAQPSDSAGGTIALEVQDLVTLTQRLKEQGVTFKSDVIRGPHCRMAMCLDSEGNSILLHQLDAAP